MNTLYYGDNLDILQRYLADESVDLVYLDPPFNSNATYNILFKEQNGAQAASQAKAFEDTWKWNHESQAALEQVVTAGGQLSLTMQAFHTILGPSNLLAYLAMMAPRLQELRRVLKPTGSIYLHCDPTASHYLKLVMDAVFGVEYFRSEVVWQRTSAHSGSKRWGPVHDTLLFYTKSDNYIWNQIFQTYTDEYKEQFYRHTDEHGRFRLGDLTGAGTRTGESGTPWKGVNPTEAGRHWAVPNKVLVEILGEIPKSWSVQQKLDALDEQCLIYWPPKGRVPQFKRYLNDELGVLIVDTVTDIKPIGAQARERLGYPTQKPEALLERILNASSNEGDLVLDPFCGCGTTVAVAHRLNRRWIGIDVTYASISVMKKRLNDAYGEAANYQVIGEPKSLPDARQLAKEDPYQFQWWALDFVNARPSEEKKGADKGIDGRLFFYDDDSGQSKQIIFSVKSGGVKVGDVRDLRGTVEREKAEMGCLISLENPTRPMQVEAVGAGFYQSPWNKKYPRIQLLTVEELLAGKVLNRPPSEGTFKKAPRVRAKGKQTALPTD